MPFGGSTVTLATGPSVAQSAHKYIQEEGISEKAKPKSRPAFGALASIQSGGRGFFAKWEKDKEGDKEEKANRHSFFTTLTEKTKFYMHQLLNTDKKESAPLKWENFVKVTLRSRAVITIQLTPVMFNMVGYDRDGFYGQPQHGRIQCPFRPP